MGQDKGYKQVKKANKQYKAILDQNTTDLLSALDVTRERFGEAAGQFGAAGQQLVQSAETQAAAQAYRKGVGGAVSGTLGATAPVLSQLAAQQAQLQSGQEEFLLNALNQIKQAQTQGYGQYAQQVAGAQQYRGNVLGDIAGVLSPLAAAYIGKPTTPQ